MSTVLPLLEPRPHARATHAARRHEQQTGQAAAPPVGQAIADFGMIEDGDKVMVCLSGGKDSYTLLDILLQLQQRRRCVRAGGGEPGPEAAGLSRRTCCRNTCDASACRSTMIEQDTYSVVKRVVPEGKTMCSLCSRLRRGALYAYAEEQGFTKIALGHHRDDLVETLFLNLFYHAKLGACRRSCVATTAARGDPPAGLRARGRHRALRRGASEFPIIPCNLCGSQENLQRKQVKGMMEAWERETPGRIETIARALGDVRPSQLSRSEAVRFPRAGRTRQAPCPTRTRGSPANRMNGTAPDDWTRTAQPSPPPGWPGLPDPSHGTGYFDVLPQPDAVPLPHHHQVRRTRQPAWPNASSSRSARWSCPRAASSRRSAATPKRCRTASAMRSG